MLSSVTRTFLRRAARPSAASFTTVSEAATVSDALKYSGYSEIDFTINEDAPVYDAVQKFAAYNIGCLVVTDAAGTYGRIISVGDAAGMLAPRVIADEAGPNA